jgi:hypothetical protein
MENTTTQNDSLDTKLSAIDKALAAAAARRAARSGEQTGSLRLSEEPTGKKAKAAPAEKPSSDDKAARSVSRAAKRKAEREERKASKVAEAASKKPAHMKKVERAASKLPALNDSAQLLFNEAVGNFSADQLTAIALHLQHFNRVKATERAVGQRVETGARVRIVGGDPKFIGREGVVELARRIRVFVNVPGFSKPAYCFTSDVEVLAAPVSESSAAVG